MYNKKRAPQKLISFSNNQGDLDKIYQDINEGWAIISLIQSGSYYIGVMEKAYTDNNLSKEKQSIFIPPRKKIKISYKSLSI